jgi:hypothetical protein
MSNGSVPNGEVKSKADSPIKATVNFKPGTEVYQFRHQDQIVSSYLGRIHANVQSLKEKFEKQLVLHPDEQQESCRSKTPAMSQGVVQSHFVHPQYRMAVSPPPAPGAVQVLPQLCSNSPAGSSSSGIGTSSSGTATDQSSGASCAPPMPLPAGARRLLPQAPAGNKVVAGSTLAKDEHNDSGYSLNRFHNGSPPISNGQHSNSNSG